MKVFLMLMLLGEATGLLHVRRRVSIQTFHTMSHVKPRTSLPNHTSREPTVLPISNDTHIEPEDEPVHDTMDDGDDLEIEVLDPLPPPDKEPTAVSGFYDERGVWQNY